MPRFCPPHSHNRRAVALAAVALVAPVAVDLVDPAAVDLVDPAAVDLAGLAAADLVAPAVVDLVAPADRVDRVDRGDRACLFLADRAPAWAGRVLESDLVLAFPFLRHRHPHLWLRQFRSLHRCNGD